MQQSYHESPRNTKHKIKAASIPGGVYMVSPLAVVSVWAALKMEWIAWHHLCVWIALFEVRTWRDTRDTWQRNIFRFTPRRIAQALGKRNAGPRLKTALAELEQLGLARLTPTEISFTTFLGELPAGLRAETDRMLKSLGNSSTTRAIRMPRRLMRLIMRSRRRPLRAAVIFGILLRIMPVKRYGRYKGCLTTALLADLSGFNQSRIKHERAILILEGFFERLETPARVRQQHGDWYALAHNLPLTSGRKPTTKQQPPRPETRGNQQPPIKKPAPSFGIETNQLLPPNPGASPALSIPGPTAPPVWHRIAPEDLRAPERRAGLYEDACEKRVITGTPAEKLMFYSAIARARRLGSLNPCGMLRRIVETTPYRKFIADCDEDQARAWLAGEQPPALDTTDACNLLNRIVESPAAHNQLWKPGDHDALESINPERCSAGVAEDSIVASYLIHQLRQAGFPTHNAFNLIMTTHQGRTNLAGWSQERWERACRTQIVDSAPESRVALIHCSGAKKPSTPVDKRQS